jgi:hypothetical protein
MNHGDDVLQQANQLMRRHRSFVAGGALPTMPEPPPTDRDDLPVLTEVVESADMPLLASPGVESPPAVAPERIEALAREMLFERLPIQRQALAEELAAWLDNELPQVIMRVLDGVTDQLVARIADESRAALLPRLQAALEEEEAPPTSV